MRYVSDSTLYKCAEVALYLAKIQIMLKKVLASYLSIIPDFYGAAQNRKRINKLLQLVKAAFKS